MPNNFGHGETGGGGSTEGRQAGEGSANTAYEALNDSNVLSAHTPSRSQSFAARQAPRIALRIVAALSLPVLPGLPKNLSRPFVTLTVHSPGGDLTVCTNAVVKTIRVHLRLRIHARAQACAHPFPHSTTRTHVTQPDTFEMNGCVIFDCCQARTPGAETEGIDNEEPYKMVADAARFSFLYTFLFPFTFNFLCSTLFPPPSLLPLLLLVNPFSVSSSRR